ncbi:MAG: CoA-binding protein [Thermoplasmata archaeon]|jgi:acetyl coenzyme A synthetase (ADP forming)-like protein|nr:CoA-binding protein [Thermoplasmata archaeon]
MGVVEDLRPIFSPKSIAVIGASRSPMKIGYEILQNILVQGYTGKVIPINPETPTIMGLKTQPSVLAVKEDLDLAIIAVPAEFVPKVMSECARKKVKGVIVISSGFAETGERGKQLEEEILQIARRGGIRLIGPNTLGYKDPIDSLDAAFVFGMPRPGEIALISQSGALCIGMIYYANGEHIGLSRVISVGNKADIDDADLIDYLSADPATKVIAMYIEGIKDGRKFLDAARRCHKPIVAIKAGRTPAGSAAASTHTGSLSGSDAVYDSAFKQVHIQRAYDVIELFDYARALAYQPCAPGNRVGIISNGGGAGIMIADWCESIGLKVPNLTKKTVDGLRPHLPSITSPRNPLDVTGDARFHRYHATGSIVLSDPNIDALIMTCVHAGIARPKEYVGAVIKLVEEKKNLKKPIVACWVGGPEIDEVVQELRVKNIPVYSSAMRAAKAVKCLYDEGGRQDMVAGKKHKEPA